MDTGKAANNCG